MSAAPKVGMVSLGCPKALVDSERILTKLRSDGYAISPSYADANVVIVNTCGFIDAAKAESLAAIDEAMAENGRVIVTGCLGKDAAQIRSDFPEVLAITGPQQYEQVVNAVQQHTPPPPHNPYIDLVPAQGIKLTPRHYAYVKIAEGCNHHCTFCIIPSMRGKLQSRPIERVIAEANQLVRAGVKELLIISQDTSAYGADLKYQTGQWRDQTYQTRLVDLCEALGEFGVWVRLHYVYPYPHVDQVIPLMAAGKILPYLDIPLQHGSERILKLMQRPAATAKTLDRIQAWRDICPELVLRSTFIVGFPGETEADFEQLLEFLQQAQLDRVGCFQYSPVAGAAANQLPNAVPDEIKQQRFEQFMQVQADISAQKLQQRIGQTLEVLIDEVDTEGAIGRSYADAPEIDGQVFIKSASELSIGMMVATRIIDTGEHDLWAEPV